MLWPYLTGHEAAETVTPRASAEGNILSQQPAQILVVAASAVLHKSIIRQLPIQQGPLTYEIWSGEDAEAWEAMAAFYSSALQSLLLLIMLCCVRDLHAVASILHCFYCNPRGVGAALHRPVALWTVST